MTIAFIAADIPLNKLGMYYYAGDGTGKADRGVFPNFKLFIFG